jgi:hypothetical protein
MGDIQYFGRRSMLHCAQIWALWNEPFGEALDCKICWLCRETAACLGRAWRRSSLLVATKIISSQANILIHYLKQFPGLWTMKQKKNTEPLCKTLIYKILIVLYLVTCIPCVHIILSCGPFLMWSVNFFLLQYVTWQGSWTVVVYSPMYPVYTAPCTLIRTFPRYICSTCSV